MPGWAQTIGEILPLTHFLRIVRGILLKGNGLAEIAGEIAAMFAFLLVAGANLAIFGKAELADPLAFGWGMLLCWGLGGAYAFFFASTFFFGFGSAGSTFSGTISGPA